MKPSASLKALAIILFCLAAAICPVCAQPVITLQPQTRTNVAGSTATFSIDAAGASPLGYQWYFNAAARSEATNSLLVLTNVHLPNQGTYSVVVSNSDGVATSAVARLYILLPPTITSQPTDRALEFGSFTRFAVTAGGTPPLAYQWHFNQSPLAGATASSLSLLSVQLTNAGTYSVMVTNLAGSVTSRFATLAIPPVRAFSRITALSNRTVALHATGTVASLYRDYFELFPIETSTNLLQWEPLPTHLRTNASTNGLIGIHDMADGSDRRFFRVFGHHLYTPNVKPTGPYAVGKVSLLLNDPSRTNRYNVPTNTSFMVSYWYPAEASGGELPDIWEDKPLAEDSNFWGSYTDRVPRLIAHSIPSPRISGAQSNYPVIIYVAGYSGTRGENQEKFEDLASHGYIVVSADHWEVYGTVFPDGRYLHGSSVYLREPGTMLTNALFALRAFDRRMQDLRIMLADLDRANAVDSVMAGRVNTNNIGLMGFSFGGGVAGEMCRTNDRCRAALFLDAYLQGADQLIQFGVQKPSLAIFNSNSGGNTTLFNRETKDATWFVLSGTVHASFAYGYEVVNPSQANRELQFHMKTYTLSFFNKYLKNRDDQLLDGPSTNFPRLVNFRKK